MGEIGLLLGATEALAALRLGLVVTLVRLLGLLATLLVLVDTGGLGLLVGLGFGFGLGLGLCGLLCLFALYLRVFGGIPRVEDLERVWGVSIGGFPSLANQMQSNMAATSHTSLSLASSSSNLRRGTETATAGEDSSELPEEDSSSSDAADEHSLAAYKMRKMKQRRHEGLCALRVWCCWHETVNYLVTMDLPHFFVGILMMLICEICFEADN